MHTKTAHEIVLQKKHDRLARHTGKVLRRKTAQLEKMLEIYQRNGFNKIFGLMEKQPGISVVNLPVEKADPKFIEAVSEGLSDVESGKTVSHEEVKKKVEEPRIIAVGELAGEPVGIFLMAHKKKAPTEHSYSISIPPHTAEPVIVQASNEKDARKAARELLKLPKLPVGTRVEKV